MPCFNHAARPFARLASTILASVALIAPAAAESPKVGDPPEAKDMRQVGWNDLQARYPGDHIEVSKPLQVLFVVRSGQVILVSHVSTGATGNTPVGRWHVYSKVPGWLPDGMFDSSFFLRGFAIHGYPTVPFYPGSHGCVRVPVWLAPRIYQYDPPGSTIYIY